MKGAASGFRQDSWLDLLLHAARNWRKLTGQQSVDQGIYILPCPVAPGATEWAFGQFCCQNAKIPSC